MEHYGLPAAGKPRLIRNVIVSSSVVSPLANTLGFVPLPPRYWLYLAIMLLGYAILTQVVKTWFIRRFGE
jgi:Mg2+-importing ATPase